MSSTVTYQLTTIIFTHSNYIFAQLISNSVDLETVVYGSAHVMWRQPLDAAMPAINRTTAS